MLRRRVSRNRLLFYLIIGVRRRLFPACRIHCTVQIIIIIIEQSFNLRQVYPHRYAGGRSSAEEEVRRIVLLRILHVLGTRFAVLPVLVVLRRVVQQLRLQRLPNAVPRYPLDIIIDGFNCRQCAIFAVLYNMCSLATSARGRSSSRHEWRHRGREAKGFWQ